MLHVISFLLLPEEDNGKLMKPSSKTEILDGLPGQFPSTHFFNFTLKHLEHFKLLKTRAKP